MKNLKARLSEHLRAVKAGETILVTERDEVIAQLGPPHAGLHHLEGSLSAALESLGEAGELVLPALPKQGWTWKVGGLGLARGAAKRLLDDVRADRV